ncbi:MAG TPA: A/G-specific adenine glycosylase [Candidatus Nanoarchaeia archaeon]|nr:A/G-specific adenine glycosylase [Candidatus Nanoarchaeia archaeon]
MDVKTVQKTILDHYKKEGRDLPWRKTTDPYKILISEVMLQQTQVPRVIEKYTHWLKVFPTFESLASASVADVLKEWQGLGYNRRALFLKKCAETVVSEYDGSLPSDPEELVLLPGIGKATAASICAFAFNKPTVFIETNVRSVFIHFFFKNKKNVSDEQLYPLVEKAVYTKNPRVWYNALMDYGVKLKSELGNPSQRSKHHVKQSKFEGSGRQLRGKVLKLLNEKSYSLSVLKKKVNDVRLESVLAQLQKEGFIEIKKNKIEIKKS